MTSPRPDFSGVTGGSSSTQPRQPTRQPADASSTRMTVIADNLRTMQEQGATESDMVAYLAALRRQKVLPGGVGRDLGLAVRVLVQGTGLGVGSTVGLPFEVFRQGVNAMGRSMGAGEPVPPAAGMAAGPMAAQGLANALGLPRPETPFERVVSAAGEEAVAAMVPAGLAGRLARAGRGGQMARVFAEAPGLQALGGAASGTAGQVAREGGASPGSEFLVRLLAGAAPAAGAVAAGATRAAMRGTDAATMRARIASAQRAGVPDPSLEMVATGGAGTTLKAASRIAPGAATPIKREAEKIAGELGDATMGLATRAGRGAVPTPTTGVRQVQRALGPLRVSKNPHSWYERFQGIVEKRYDRLTQTMSAKPMQPAATTVALLDVLEPPGMVPAAKGVVQKDNPGLVALRQDLADIMQNHTLVSNGQRMASLNYPEFRALRSRIGRMIQDDQIVGQVDVGNLRRVYDAMTRDLEAHAAGIGGDALKQLKEADAFYNAGISQYNDFLKPIVATEKPGKILRYLTGNTKDDAVELEKLMGSLRGDERRALSSITLQRMGRDPNSAHFNPRLFAKQWRRIGPEAKQALFGHLGTEFNDDLARVVDLIETFDVQSGQVLQATGTAGASVAARGIETAGRAAMAPLMRTAGRPKFVSPGARLGSRSTTSRGPRIGVGAMIGTANLFSRVITSPRAVRWLARSTRIPVEQFPVHLRNLERLATTGDRDERETAQELFDFYVQEYGIPLESVRNAVAPSQQPMTDVRPAPR